MPRPPYPRAVGDSGQTWTRRQRGQGRATCSIPGCDRNVAGRGWCMKHYLRWRTHGDPAVKMTNKGESAVYRLLDSVCVTPRGCWVRESSLIKGGYSVLSVDGKLVFAHRYAHEFWNGPIPDGFEVDHLCRQPACCNPEHLEAVTPRVNWERSQSRTRINALKAECLRGHPFDKENTYVDPSGGRTCRACRRERNAAWKKARRA